MSESSSKQAETMTVSLNRYGINSVVREFSIVIFFAIILFQSAGHLDWLNAWIYITWLLIFSSVFMVAMVQYNHWLLNLRGSPTRTMRSGQMRRYDKVFFAFYTPLYVATPILAGLDAGRFLWSIMPNWLMILGLVFVIIGEGIFGWAMVANRFFDGVVRILTDQGHYVVSSGPYRFLRHPGYLGQILYTIGIPLLLGSWWAIIPSLVLVILFVARTAKEDQTLQNELKGYAEYREQVRFRLLPGFW